ncbi:MAG: precorrin-6Y C5,15-methyltransferase (decarboxylating) subunit CbiT, partial [Stellaceae bacterium]
VEGGAEARILPLGAGLDDAFFAHDGQITKREVRAITLAALAPRRGDLLWDVGAGAGSIAIEWMLLHPSLRAVAIEADATRAERIRGNAAACGVPDLRVIEGRAPQALAGLPQADAIFIGGGADGAIIDTAIQALRAGGRLVANAVTLETEALILGVRTRLGGEVVRIGIERAAPLGALTGWRPAMPVLQWRWLKP